MCMCVYMCMCFYVYMCVLVCVSVCLCVCVISQFAGGSISRYPIKSWLVQQLSMC